jgi:hypothetical protein
LRMLAYYYKLETNHLQWHLQVFLLHILSMQIFPHDYIFTNEISWVSIHRFHSKQRPLLEKSYLPKILIQILYYIIFQFYQNESQKDLLQERSFKLALNLLAFYNLWTMLSILIDLR